MNDSDDKALHQLIRRQLDGYQVPFRSEDWEEMRHTLTRKRRWRVFIWPVILVGFGALGGIVWRQLSAETETSNEITYRKTTVTCSPSFPKKRIIRPTKLAGAAVAPVTSKPKKEDIEKEEKRIQPVDSELTDEPLDVENRIALTPEVMEGKSLQMMALPRAFPQIPIRSPEEQGIRHQMLTGDYGSDSTSFQVLARNAARWTQSVFVCDFTSSMYPYSTQLFAWFRQHAKHPSIQGMVFFTDCDSLGQETKPGGLKGKMFVTRERDTNKVLPLLLEASRNTLNNKEEAENSIEALIEAQLRFPEAKQLVLIADNSSGVKDLHRLHEVKKPVRVVICGTVLDSKQAFQSDFYEIARQTNGSLHTIEDDFKPTSVTHRSWIKIGQQYYWYNARREKFVPSRFRERPTHVLGLFWF